MKPNLSDRRVEGNLTGDRVAMSLDQNALAHIMSVLTDLYSDPELAVIREYATNALDSHVEAGIRDPIEVTLPSPLSPFFKVKDHGVGLSVDDVHEIYSKYGASTRRGTNDATGMLGLGCKAALTYSAQFTLIAVKDGVRATVAVSRDEDGAGSMTIVDTSGTSEPNGVEISIPAKSGNEIESKAREFFRYWSPGTVLLNGKQPKPLEGLQISADIMLCESDQNVYRRVQIQTESKIVMGNVAYPAGELSGYQGLDLPYGYYIVARVPIGAVDFAPSREQLQFTKRTKQRIEQVKQEYKTALAASVQREIEDAPSRPAAAQAYQSWAKLLPSSAAKKFFYKGSQVPTELKCPGGQRLLVTDNSNYHMSSSSNLPAVGLNYINDAIFVTDYSPVKLTPTHKKKMRQWAEKQSYHCSKFALLDFPADLSWIDPSRVVGWDTINAEQLPRKVRTPGSRLPGSYDVIVADEAAGRGYHIEREKPGDKIDFTHPVYWMHGNVTNGYYNSSEFIQFEKKFTLICLSKNRIEKFRRDNPKIQNIDDRFKVEFDKWEKKLTKRQRLALTIQSNHVQHHLSAYRSVCDQILDPAVRDAVRAATGSIDNLVRERRAWQRRGMWVELEKWENPLDKYPLQNSYKRAESVDYMNWLYKK